MISPRPSIAACAACLAFSLHGSAQAPADQSREGNVRPQEGGRDAQGGRDMGRHGGGVRGAPTDAGGGPSLKPPTIERYPMVPGPGQ